MSLACGIKKSRQQPFFSESGCFSFFLNGVGTTVVDGVDLVCAKIMLRSSVKDCDG